jgi:hypothetical protein
MIRNAVKKLSNIPGWRTKRKIIVIESDDWGSIMMPSKKAYESLKRAGLNVGKGGESRYNQYDTLASSTDLDALFEVLNSVKDKNKHSAKFTALSLVANPDFQKIVDNNFEEYYYEYFTETLSRYNQSNVLQTWKEGINANIFYPEFHGREHLNVQLWLRALQQKDKHTRIAFDHGMWGFNRGASLKGYQAAFDLEFLSDVHEQHNIIEDGLNIFKKLHGYQARFFVPPNGPINNQLEETAADKGVKFMSSPKIQAEVWGEGRIKKHFRYLGKKNKHQQIYITRNAFFEPTGSNKDEIDYCINDISLAFKFKKPAVISSHRVNYIGVLDENNRTNSLHQLKILLSNIVQNWPDVEFMTSTELGDIISQSK